MTDSHEPTEALIRRALDARAAQTTVNADALDAIRERTTPRWARPAIYGAVAAVVAVIAGLALLSGDDGSSEVEPATTTVPDDTTTVPDDTATTLPDTAADAGRALWPPDGVGADSAEGAARGWVENVLGVSPDALTGGADSSGDDSGSIETTFRLPLSADTDIQIVATSADDGVHWFVERAQTPGVDVDLVERNGTTGDLRVTGTGQAPGAPGLLWVDGAGPTVVALGTDEPRDFSVVVPWSGASSVSIRLESNRVSPEGVPAVHAFVIDPSDPVTDVRVTRVADDDVLNVRTGAGVDNDIAYTLAHDATGLSHTGETEVVGGETWWEITDAGGESGWANTRFLAVWRPVDDRLAARMIDQARAVLSDLSSTTPKSSDRPPTHPNGTQVGGIGVFGDAPSPFTTVDLWDDALIDWDPFPDEAEPCGDYCLRTVAEFLDVRERDVAEATYTIGPDPGADAQLSYFTGLDQDYYDRHMTLVAYVRPSAEGELDWRRFTFAFDLVDGAPIISAVWLWGWTP